MGVEIERKFLVVSDDWKLHPKGVSWRYTQGYLSFGDDNSPEIRVRVISPVDDNDRMRSEAVITVKGKGDLSRSEVETQIDIEDARELLSMCKGTLIQKTRHLAAEKSGLTFEIDIYEGELHGLQVAEIELPSEDAVFDRPSFLGDEVTLNKGFKNAALAQHGAPRLAPSPRMKV